MLTYNQIQSLFDIEDTAKNCSLYYIADSVFVVLLAAYKETATDNNVFSDVIPAFEADYPSEAEQSLADPQGTGHYDLPTFFLHGDEGFVEDICIPLPLLSEAAIAYLRESFSDGSLWVIGRGEHSREVNFLKGEEAHAAKEDLLQRLHAIFSPAAIEAARAEYLAPRRS